MGISQLLCPKGPKTIIEGDNIVLIKINTRIKIVTIGGIIGSILSDPCRLPTACVVYVARSTQYNERIGEVNSPTTT
jgi:hypothetical protein